MQNILPVFKYGSLISPPLFAIIMLSLINGADGFSYRNHTVSKTVLFLNNSSKIRIFKLSFLIKAILDLGFVMFVLGTFEISPKSLFAWDLVLAASLFGTLAIFTERKHALLHYVVIYSVGILWAFGELYLAYLTGDRGFIALTYVLAFLPAALAFVYLLNKKTNVFVQAFCILIMYIWHLIFVFNYL